MKSHLPRDIAIEDHLEFPHSFIKDLAKNIEGRASLVRRRRVASRLPREDGLSRACRALSGIGKKCSSHPLWIMGMVKQQNPRTAVPTTSRLMFNLTPPSSRPFMCSSFKNSQ